MLLLLTTGGTIDKMYDPVAGTLGFGEATRLLDILEQARSKGQVTLKQLMLKDSLEISNTDRQAIHDACAQAPESRIVITHGTDTMTQTADVLHSSSLLAAKTIVLTGAMIPHSIMKPASDAAFNVGQALAYASQLEPGVYITMGGQLFKAGTVKKDTTLGIFKPIG